MSASSSIIGQSSRQIPCSSSWAQGSRDPLCHHSTTAAVTSTRRSLSVLGGRDRAANSHGNGRFPSHIASALAQSCADESRSKYQDCRLPPHSKIRDGLDRPAPATSTRSPCCHSDILSKGAAGDGSRYKSSRETSLSLGPSPSPSRAGVWNVVAKSYGCPRSMRGGACTGCKRGLRLVSIGIGYPQ